MLIAAFFWWFKLVFKENMILARELERLEKDRVLREERVKQLLNKN